MKPFITTKSPALLLGTLSHGVAASTAHADTLLQVLVTDPTAVKLIATENKPSWDVFLMQSEDGFTLMDLFTSDSSFRTPTSASGTLTAPAYPMVGAFNYVIPNNYTPSYGDGRHLSVWQDPRSLMKFASGTRAFSGTLSVDLSQWGSLLTTTEGYIGEIRPGNGNVQGASMGQYEIIVSAATTSGDVTPTPSPNPTVGNWNVGGSIIIGDTATGDLQLKNYVTVTSTTAHIGNQAGSTGTVTVNSSSTWNNSGDIYVGNGGSGQLSVGNQSKVTTQTIYTAMSSLQGSGLIQTHGVVLDFASPSDKLVFDSSHGTSQAINFGSTGSMELTIDGTGALGVGYRGTGEMQIQDERKVSSSEGHLGMLAGSSGTATVTGAGSEWNVSTDLHIGQGGSGSLIVAAGGSVTASSLTVYSAGDSLTLDGGSVATTGGVFINSGATLGGSGTITGNLTLASGAMLAFDPNSTLTVPYAVTIDSSFGIANLTGLDAGAAIGGYTLINHTATDFSTLNLQNWGIANFYDLGSGKAAYFEQNSAYLDDYSLVVQVVPEPSTCVLLLGIGTPLFARRVRK